MSRSKYFILFCVAFISGIFFGSYFSIPIWFLFLLVGLFISLVFLFRKKNNLYNKDNLEIKKDISISFNKKLFIFILMFGIFLLLGFIRVESVKLSAKKIIEIENLNNQKISVYGIISKMPEIKNGKQKLTLRNIKVIGSDKNIDGKIIAYIDEYPEYSLSDKIELNGKLKIPKDFDGFEYKNYLFSQGIYYILYYPKVKIIKKNKEGIYSQISQFRIYANKLIEKIFPEPQSGIISAMTLGIKSGISEETLGNFNKTGTRHIIAISGLHMTIVTVILMYLLLAIGLKRNYAFYFAIFGIAFFVTLVGFPPSAVRAGLMGGLVLLAIKVGRLGNVGNAIIFVGVLMLLYNPNLLRYNTGFQLSFLAVLGIIYIFPKLDFYFKKYSDYLKIKTMFLITISAQLATLPIIINSFEKFSLFSVFANILILPFVPIVMLGGFLVIIISFANLFIAQVLAFPIWIILSYQINVIKFFASFDIGYFSFNTINTWIIVIYYVILVILLNYKKMLKIYSLKS